MRRLRTVHLHALGNLAAIGVAIAHLVVHWVAPTQHVVGLVLSAATAAILRVTGWLGGLLSYKYRIGQIAPEYGDCIPQPDPAKVWMR